MSAKIKKDEGKLKILLPKEVFHGLENVVLELMSNDKPLFNTRADFYPPKYYYIKQVPEQGLKIMIALNELKEIKYYQNNDCYTITF